MRQFIGHTLKVLADNFPSPVEGIMVEDRTDRILLKGKDGKVTRIIKSHISGFTPMDFEPFEFVPFHVMFCANEKIGCPGVQFIKEGPGVAASEYEQFMGPCPCHSDTCKFGMKGELRTVNGEVLRQMLAGTMYGDYPEKEEAKSGSAKTSAGRTGGKIG
jgi:hypothetical protein